MDTLKSIIGGFYALSFFILIISGIITIWVNDDKILEILLKIVLTTLVILFSSAVVSLFIKFTEKK